MLCTECGGDWGSGILLPAAGLLGLLLVAIGTLCCVRKSSGSSDLEVGCLRAYVQKQLNRLSRAGVKIRILLSTYQVLTTLGVVFDLPRLPFYSKLMRQLSFFSLDFVRLMPLGWYLPPPTRDTFRPFRPLHADWPRRP